MRQCSIQWAAFEILICLSVCNLNEAAFKTVKSISRCQIFILSQNQSHHLNICRAVFNSLLRHFFGHPIKNSTFSKNASLDCFSIGPTQKGANSILLTLFSNNHNK